ncbi:MAG: AMP-binding protein [Hyphomicrobiaceae bacterium]
MIPISARNIGEVIDEAARRYAPNPFLMVPRDPSRHYDPEGRTESFATFAQKVNSTVEDLRATGYGHGHRIAVLLENRVECAVAKFACATCGITWVPINPDYRPAEIAYILQDSQIDMAMAVPERETVLREAVSLSGADVAQAIFDEQGQCVFPAARSTPPLAGMPHPQSQASVLYTSGTTGQPKGCILSHEYELFLGQWYATRGGLMALSEGCERLYNPLPLFHVNAGVVSLYAMMLLGGCQVLPERFSKRRWWREIRETQSTIIHYLGVVVPALLNAPPEQDERNHRVRFGFGAGLEPTLHHIFEERFGFPLIEGWGMTEMCRILVDNYEPRLINTRAMGRPQPGLEVRVVDENDHDVPIGQPGEMIVRHSPETPRFGAFSGYLNQADATEQAWRGGWFHTGDTVRQDATGTLFFIERKKNIIRRSGENIAAAEVEAALQGHDRVAQVAVVAVSDVTRDEEVLACVVLATGPADAASARLLFEHCYTELAYYKAPGWIIFVDTLPVTGTQKVLKHKIFDEAEDPLSRPDAFDLRYLKRRTR